MWSSDTDRLTHDLRISSRFVEKKDEHKVRRAGGILAFSRKLYSVETLCPVSSFFRVSPVFDNGTVVVPSTSTHAFVRLQFVPRMLIISRVYYVSGVIRSRINYCG